ncbi:MAG: DUF465 domain-containing protein [Acidobacteria bacterium]|nr:MAG: DUF465 domain-containing protein [Acidobacteriota bacterium]
MPIPARSPRDVLLDAEYQQLAQQHSQYEAELERLAKATYLSSEDLLEEVKLKKMKLLVKDQMEQILTRHRRAQNGH